MNTKLSVFCEKIIEAGWLAAVVSVPLFFNIYTARTFEPDKITLLRSIVSLMILAWIVMVVEQGRVGQGETSLSERFKNWLKAPFVLPTLLLVIIYIISTIFSISPQVSLWGSYQRLQGTYSALSYIVVFALMAGYLHTREQVDRLTATIILTSIPVSLYGIVQRFGLDPLPWAGDVTTRVASNMGNAIFVASYLIMVMPLTMVRLLESMAAIVKEEKASWGHTILAAVYIFALAVQTLTVIFSQSRGPMLGVLTASFIIGLLVLLMLRQLSANASGLSLSEIFSGIGFVFPLGLVGVAGAGIGYLMGWGLESVAGWDYVTLIGAAIGGLIGFLSLYAYMAAAGKGWRWLWLSWLGTGIVALLVVVALNISTPLDPYVAPIKQIPYLNRLSQITETSATGRVRILIWDAALELIRPHDPLGITDDSNAGPDNFNVLRPLIGYGPESMFNAFAYVYPPGLAHVEARGSSADRSHNETMDSLVITGVLGFAVFYYLMFTVFYYAGKWLGWATDKASRRRLIFWMVLGGILGAGVPYLAEGDFTFMAIGLPFGMVAGFIIHLVWQGVARLTQNPGQDATVAADVAQSRQIPTYELLVIGVLGAIVGHFIEVHFVFSIAATYIYFWVFLGMLVGLHRVQAAELAAVAESAPPPDEPVAAEQLVEEVSATRRTRKGRSRRARQGTASSSPTTAGYTARQESWETWVGVQGLSTAIILMILTFDFVTPQFQFEFSNEDSMSLLWMLVITWLVGFAITLSTLLIRKDEWKGQVSWGRGIALFSVTSLSYFFFYMIAHRLQFGQRIAVTGIEDVIRAANVLVYGLVLFYIFLLLLMVIIALMLSWRLVKGLNFWRSENWWLYPPLVVAILAVIWFKNMDVVRADTYLKEGERYRNNRQWNEAIALHEKARSIDSDEDFYYLMLALDYQLMAQDNNLDAAARQRAWQEGERIALEARNINPYNPDNTGNMGRYYFTLGQIFDREKFNDALDYFEKSITLAPSNVIYHNLLAQTHYIMGNYDQAIDRLQTSISIDGKYPPTWILLGDAHAAKGDIDQALDAHSHGMLLATTDANGWGNFADQFLDQRLNFYISAGRGEDITTAMQQVTAIRPTDAGVQWAIGHAYNIMGQRDKAAQYFEQARTLGDTSERTLRELANLHLAANQFEQASPIYLQLLDLNPDDIEAHSALAFIFAQQGNLVEAISHNQKVLEKAPDDYDSLKNLAILYQQKGDLQQALDAAKKAQETAPEAEKPSWDGFIANMENLIAAGS